MKPIFIVLLLHQFACSTGNKPSIKAYQERASRVTIIRDNWGVPHVYGKTDADAVFGLMYAQCEESFERVERNYIERFGRLAEIEGESLLYEDLQMRLLYDTAAAKSDYDRSPTWLKQLCQGFADGINYYIALHPNQPKVLSHFEPWFPLMFTDGGYTATQTGGITSQDVERMYKEQGAPGASLKRSAPPQELDGSNGFAIAPSRSASGQALLYINPHVSFYFRTEMHMVSEEGLNAYGAITWGQFFVFQGFNENCGWMHTSSLADAADVYEEKVSRQGNNYVYAYNGQQRNVSAKKHALSYLKNGNLRKTSITAYYTHHGPVMGKRNGHWLSLKERNRSLNGLIQSWQRTKAKDLEAYKQTLELQSNNSTNTLYADNKGNIAYWHGNFIPKRDSTLNTSLPLDGSTSKTEWQGNHKVDEIVHLLNPVSGWLQNCNSTPFSASGFNTLNSRNYPAYMAPDGENFRSLLAIRLLQQEPSFNLQKLIDVGYNNYLPAFDSLLPPLFYAYDALPANHPQKEQLSAPIAILRAWDKRSGKASVATTLAVEWGYILLRYRYQNIAHEPSLNQVDLFTRFAKTTDPEILVNMLSHVVDQQTKMHGKWQVPWGTVNRYQRLSGAVHQQFDDDESSLPVGLASSIFGSLPSFEPSWTASGRGYGEAGNSFVAVVEFGPKIKARSILTGGQSFDPDSKHFNDQANGFINGQFKNVYFYKDQLIKNAERTYHPGE
ncbi:acylase [Segetibacter sp. 3557_3]|uniref:penicillin acylase family protein n=1 Tax=Segetibacter sp. 3557_3 TaxID=2547429 RepID=UPI001058A87C|nr:penicillin acylase family protein [Segetibacter sp. 3557_3]TDH20681.1 acylase [Segetibacter sp. 3557_3]